MKDFIKHSLRLILESRIDEAIKYSSKRDLERFLFTVLKYKNLYGNDEYFEKINDGDSILRVSVDYRGVIANISTPRVSADIAKSQLGLVAVDSTYIVFHITAGRGIEHPGTYSEKKYSAITRKSGKIEYDTFMAVNEKGELIDYKVAKPGSPASDAMIKTYINFHSEIEGHIKKNMKGFDIYTADDSGAELAGMRNTPKLVDKMTKKLELSNRKSKSNLKSSDELKSLQSEKDVLNDKLIRLRRLSGKEVRDEIKDIRQQIKIIDDKIKGLDSDWNEFKRQNN